MKTDHLTPLDYAIRTIVTSPLGRALLMSPQDVELVDDVREFLQRRRAVVRMDERRAPRHWKATDMKTPRWPKAQPWKPSTYRTTAERDDRSLVRQKSPAQ